MSEKPSYEALAQRIKALETENEEKARIAEAFARRQKYLESVFHHAPSAIITLDSSHCVLDWNPGAQKIFGYSSQEVLGRNLDDLVTGPDVRQDACENTRKVLSGQFLKPVEVVRYRKDGTRVQAIAAGAPILVDNVLKGVVALYTDITDRKQAEKRLIKSEQRFRDLFNSISDFIYTQDFNGCFTSVNPALCKALGYEADELIGTCISDFMKPEFVPAFTSEYMEPIKQQGHQEGRAVYFKKNGEKLYLEYKNALVRPEDGDPFISGVGRDITEKVLSERKLVELQEQVAQSQKMESIGILTGGIAHDFNNILYAISGNVELALGDIPKENSAYANLEAIKSASLRAADIVKQLVNFTRKTDQQLKPMGAVSLIQNALNFLRPIIPSTIKIQKHMTVDDITILADPIQINQALINLCTNASQAMEKTGGTLEICVETATIEAGSVKNFIDLAAGKYAKITIRDTGSGIDSDILHQIFDPYFTTKEMGDGSGMGLSIVHGIVKNHNGAVWVDSKPGKGTTVNLLFPVVDEKPEIEIEVKTETPFGTETLLFVDDEKPINIMAKIMLKRLGYKVETRLNPVEALDLFQSKPDGFDLVITDMTMPQMTGVQLSEKLMEIRSDIPVIICTGHSSLIDEKKAKKLGLAGYIMKPISMSRLAKSIRKVLD